MCSILTIVGYLLMNCLMTAETQYLYGTVLESIITLISSLKPVASMLDWDRSTLLNAFLRKLVTYSNTRIKITLTFKVHPFVDGSSILPASLFSLTFNLIVVPSLVAAKHLMKGKL